MEECNWDPGKQHGIRNLTESHFVFPQAAGYHAAVLDPICQVSSRARLERDALSHQGDFVGQYLHSILPEIISGDSADDFGHFGSSIIQNRRQQTIPRALKYTGIVSFLADFSISQPKNQLEK